ncbi:MAG: CBS domain-containing protein [Methanobrevibacter sp.]|jgi:CBS domain-containing protein|nr:CBS domain-containing protein [Candidatus Methanovirga basalitermitum]
MFKDLKVEDLMTEGVVTIVKNEDVVFAFEKLMKNKISALPVVDGDKLIGLVSATDLGHNLILDHYKLGTKVENVMITNVKSVSPKSSVQDAITLMSENIPDKAIFNQLPVVENNKLVGILADGDIIRAINDKL